MAEQEAWERWIPVIEKLLWQCYYRVLSFISFPAPIDESYEAVQYLSELERPLLHDYGGEVHWVSEPRVFRWDDLELTPEIKMGVWFMGSALRRKNSVMIRRGWWTLYLREPIYVLMTGLKPVPI